MTLDDQPSQCRHRALAGGVAQRVDTDCRAAEGMAGVLPQVVYGCLNEEPAGRLRPGLVLRVSHYI